MKANLPGTVEQYYSRSQTSNIILHLNVLRGIKKKKERKRKKKRKEKKRKEKKRAIQTQKRKKLEMSGKELIKWQLN